MRAYQALLHLYPKSFRSEYGAEMANLFERRWRAAGWMERLELSAGALWEVSWNAAAAHSDILRQDLRYTARTLRRSPGFAFTVVMVLALGVGANTAAFSITDYVLVRPLPFAKSQQLVKLWENVPGYNRMELSPPNYRDWKRMSRSFSGMAVLRGLSVNLAGDREPERLDGASVTADLFPLLGVQPALGRVLTGEDDRESAAGVVVLSERLWQSRFAGDPGVLGRTVRLDEVPYTVVGVMPRDFYFPTREAQLWTAMRFAPQDFEDRGNNYLQAVARLKPGVTLAEAQAEMRLIAGQLEREYPKDNQKTGANTILLRDEISQQSRLLLWSLCGAALCVLLIACANLANLQLARVLGRQRELAVRTALGAGEERLVRQLLTESLTLTALGGALGALVGMAALPLLSRLAPNALPLADAPPADWRVLGWAAALTAVTGIGFGVLPAFRACRRAALTALREGPRAGTRGERVRSALVVAEVAGTVILLVGAGLFLRALGRVQAVDPGFAPGGAVKLMTVLPMPKYEKTAARTAFYGRVLGEVRALPGVTAAGYTSFAPLTIRGGIWPVLVDGRPKIQPGDDTASLRFVTPGYFAALGLTLRQGRDVSESDGETTPAVAVVSESFVERYWPGENPIGKHFAFAMRERQVAGVVGSVRTRGLERPSEPQVYLPYRQMADASMTWYAPKDLVVRSSGNTAALVPAIRRIIAAADAEQPVSDVKTLAELVAGETVARSVQLRVLGSFAGLALLLAAVGIHGLLSFAVSQREREIGVRVALGANPADILRMVLRRGMLLALAGAAPGLALAYAGAYGLQALLAGVQPGDATTFVAAGTVAFLMTAAGSLAPALRAVRVDPISAMRAE
jgi:predicted permease